MIKNTISRFSQSAYLIPVVGIKIHGLVESLRGSRDYQRSDYWNDSLQGWASSYLGGTFSNELRNSVTVRLAKQIAPTATSILDLGCAGASLSQALGPEFETYCGVDISEVAISSARESHAVSDSKSPRHLQFDVSNVQDYQPTRKFDVIVFNEVMYYLTLKQIANAVHRYSGFLSPGGVMLVSLKDHPQCRSVQSLLMQELQFVHAVLFQEQSSRTTGWKIFRNRETPAFLVQAFRPKNP